ACLAQFESWGVSRQLADGSLPAPGVYGIPEQWSHILEVYERAGFKQQGHTEIVLMANVDELPRAGTAPIAGITLRRSVGVSGTRLSAVIEDEVVGSIEVESREDAERAPRHAGWSDVGNLRVLEAYRRRGVGTWLMAQAADW